MRRADRRARAQNHPAVRWLRNYATEVCALRTGGMALLELLASWQVLGSEAQGSLTTQSSLG